MKNKATVLYVVVGLIGALSIYNTLYIQQVFNKETRRASYYQTTDEQRAYLSGADDVCEHTCELKYDIKPFSADWMPKIQKCRCKYIGLDNHIVQNYQERLKKELCKDEK